MQGLKAMVTEALMHAIVHASTRAESMLCRCCPAACLPALAYSRVPLHLKALLKVVH